MNRWIKRGLCAALLSVGFVGCDNPDTVKVDAPGVDVQAGPAGTKIDAEPGTRIGTASDGSVKVDAPNADVKVGPDGVDVKAPGVDIETKP